MKSVFDASTGVEAYMIKNMLATYDIESEVFGEHLQGGVGELQAIGLARVMVEPEVYDQAKGIVREWEEIEVEPIEVVKPASKSRGFLFFFVGLVSGMALVFVVLNTPVTTGGIDYDGDGNLEEKWTYNGNLLRKTEYDRNDDGVVDEVYNFDLEALIKSGELDENFDGVFETRERYKDGNIISLSIDVDADGFQEYRESFIHGVITRASFYDPETKRIKKTVYWDNGLRRESTEIDLDDDGELETKYAYDQYEEIIE